MQSPETFTDSRTMPTTPSPDQITTHVLDQTTGRPASNLLVTLTCPHVDLYQWEALTHPETGRITNWEPINDRVPTLKIFIDDKLINDTVNPKTWSLNFDTEGYFGKGKTFYPEITITFTANLDRSQDHFHLPVLLGPYGYTTYRGS